MKNLEKASQLHRESVIIDGLNISEWDDDGVLIGIHRGGVTAVNATIAVWENFIETVDTIGRWYLKFDKLSEVIVPIQTVADIERAKIECKTGIIFGFQNACPIEDDLRRLRILYELGVRIIQLTYNNSNLLGAGCTESPDYGLTKFGRDFICECNRLGILVDLSHVGYKTTMDAIEASAKPVSFTHVGPRALFNHPRNKTDEQLKALADRGGVVGANAATNFMAAWLNATLSDYLDTIDYMVNLIGVNHVGIGCDFTESRSLQWFRWLHTGRNVDLEPKLPKEHRTVGGIIQARYPEGFLSAANFPKLTLGLLDRGYSDCDIRKIMGENFLNLLRKVWA